jgi:hypothetical protein
MRDRGTVLDYRPRPTAEARALINVEIEQQFLGALLTTTASS